VSGLCVASSHRQPAALLDSVLDFQPSLLAVANNEKYVAMRYTNC